MQQITLPEFSLVLPCFNEQDNLESTVRQACAWLQERRIEAEIIVVNDGSTDGTARKLRCLFEEVPLLRVVSHDTNRGYGSAVISGCDAARGRLIAFMDTDGQFDIADFNNLLPHLEQFPFIAGRRKKRADNMFRTVNAKLFGGLIYALLRVWVRDMNCAMKVFRRDLWPRIRPQISTGALFNAEMFYRMQREGIPWVQVEVRHFPRKYGSQTGARPSVILRMFRELWHLKLLKTRGT